MIGRLIICSLERVGGLPSSHHRSQCLSVLSRVTRVIRLRLRRKFDVSYHHHHHHHPSFDSLLIGHLSSMFYLIHRAYEILIFLFCIQSVLLYSKPIAYFYSNENYYLLDCFFFSFFENQSFFCFRFYCNFRHSQKYHRYSWNQSIYEKNNDDVIKIYTLRVVTLVRLLVS